MNHVTEVGNVTRTPEMKYLPNGQATTRFSIAVNRRWQNRQTNEWEEKVSYFDVTTYGTLAENVANSIDTGYRVVVTGRLEQRSWETEDGTKRSIVEIVADDVAPSLFYATATVTKNAPRSSSTASTSNSSSAEYAW